MPFWVLGHNCTNHTQHRRRAGVCGGNTGLLATDLDHHKDKYQGQRDEDCHHPCVPVRSHDYLLGARYPLSWKQCESHMQKII